MYTSKYLCMWQGVCSHLSRWYPFQVVCARVHHLTCAFTHMQRIHGSMLDSLSVSMSVSVNVYEARSCPVISFPSASTHSLASTRTQVWAVVRACMRVGVKSDTQPNTHNHRHILSHLTRSLFSFPPSVSLFLSHILSAVAVQCAISCSRTLHAHTRIHPRECQRTNSIDIRIYAYPSPHTVAQTDNAQSGVEQM